MPPTGHVPPDLARPSQALLLRQRPVQSRARGVLSALVARCSPLATWCWPLLSSRSGECFWRPLQICIRASRWAWAARRQSLGTVFEGQTLLADWLLRVASCELCCRRATGSQLREGRTPCCQTLAKRGPKEQGNRYVAYVTELVCVRAREAIQSTWRKRAN